MINDEFKFGFSDSFGNFYGDRSGTVPEELRKVHERVVNEAKMAADCMAYLEEKYGERDPGQLAACLMNFVLSFYVNDAIDVREPSEVSMTINEMKKKADAVIASMLKHSKGGPDEVIAVLGLAFNMIYTATRLVKEQNEQQKSAFNLFDEIEKSIRKNLGK